MNKVGHEENMRVKKEYTTNDVAKEIGIHVNTVRLYEEWGLIPKPLRKANGYRIFTVQHMEQFRLARTAFHMEILQNGLRKKVIEIVRLSAKEEYDKAIIVGYEYQDLVEEEINNAKEAINITKEMLDGDLPLLNTTYTRKDVSEILGITMDTLRNWELNGLITIKRKENGYRIYTEEDMLLLKVIRTLRCANYSLSSILRMLLVLQKNEPMDVEAVLNTPREDEDIILACDRLMVSLETAKVNINLILDMLYQMKSKYTNPTL